MKYEDIITELDDYVENKELVEEYTAFFELLIENNYEEDVINLLKEKGIDNIEEIRCHVFCSFGMIVFMKATKEAERRYSL